MSRAHLIYPLEKIIKRELEKISKDPYNSQVLLRFYKIRSSQVNLATMRNEIVRLRSMSEMLDKKFEDATIHDIEDLCFHIDSNSRSPHTVNKYWRALREFYCWLRNCSKGEFPPEVKWIKMKKVPMVSVTSKDLVPFSDVLKITEFAHDLQHKALWQCKLDVGCRIGEILTVKLNEVQFNDDGAILECDGKTGNEVPLILTWSAKTLGMWINQHPFRHMPDAPLWVLDRKEPRVMTYAAAYQSFRRMVKRSNYPKHMWPHLLKHVSSTHDSEIGLPESFRKYKHHWSPNSRMSQVYEHLSRTIIPKIQKQSLGLIQDNENSSQSNIQKISVIQNCKRCSFNNPVGSKYCNKCSFPLNDSIASKSIIVKSKLEIILSKLEENPEKLDKILSIIA